MGLLPALHRSNSTPVPLKMSFWLAAFYCPFSSLGREEVGWMRGWEGFISLADNPLLLQLKSVVSPRIFIGSTC